MRTLFDPNPELLSCGWLLTGDDLAVPQEWLAAARRTGRVALVCADLNRAANPAGAAPSRDAVSNSPRQTAPERWPTLAGLAVLDDLP